MKIAAIKELIKSYDLETLRALEEDILEERAPAQEVPGSDEGEQLTHLSGAIWSIEQSQQNGTKAEQEVRAFAQRVRNSIS